jgi:hypothetical protein
MLVPSIATTAIRQRTNVLPGAAFAFAFLVLATVSLSSSPFVPSATIVPSLGFVFFDDGCYTMGPLSIGKDHEKEDDAFLSCLVLQESDLEGRRRRLTVSFGGGSPNTEISRAAGPISHTATTRTKPRFGDENNNQSSPTTPVCSEDADKTNENPAGEEEEATATVTIEEIKRDIRCRMRSESQPWMLQRAKWETLLPSQGATGGTNGADADASAYNQDEDDNNVSLLENSEHFREPFCWVVSEPAQDFYERFGITADVETSHSFYEGSVVQCGFACPKSKTLRMLACQYQISHGSFDSDVGAGSAALCGILRVEGTVRFDRRTDG